MTTSTQTSRGEYAKSAGRRRDIIAAAVEVFSESGFREGSLRDVAKRVGMTHAGMRHHFPTKVALLEAVLRWREAGALDQARAIQPTGQQALLAWITAVAANTSRPFLVELEITLAAEAIAADHPAHEYFDQLYRRGLDILEKAFVVLQERGQLPESTTPLEAAQLFLSATLGIQALWLRDRSIDVSSALRRQLQMMMTAELEDPIP